MGMEGIRQMDDLLDDGQDWENLTHYRTLSSEQGWVISDSEDNLRKLAEDADKMTKAEMVKRMVEIADGLYVQGSPF